jgi:Zn-dependent protease
MIQLLISLPVLVFSIVPHEVAHGWAARQQGDNTAYMLGRLTLNPLPHIDPIGSILVPAILSLMPGGLIFGWARPVPVNPRNFRNYKRGDIIVSLAGVTVNLILAILFIFVLAGAEWMLRFFPGLAASWQILGAMAWYGVQINLVLMIFNLIPIPPLDGSHVFYYLLPVRWAVKYRQIGMRGMVVLMLLLWFGGPILTAPLNWLFRIALSIKDLLVLA